jgi:hypothetical protein
VVVTGHAHQWRSRQVGPQWWIWAPSTWAVAPDEVQPTIGTKQVGLVELDLDRSDTALADGGWSRLVLPAGIAANPTRRPVPAGRP